ncbi:CAP domain-containing protein [Rhizoctonia solani]|nr:CAP domain-containing protein [Rhizoctonia solani]
MVSSTTVLTLAVTTGTHLSFNATSHAAHNLSARAVWTQREYIDAHNIERAKQGAAALIWDDSLSTSAQAWSDQCKFEHSHAGQNLAAGTGGPTPATVVGGYDPNNPQPSHWAQVVWKSSTRLGCAMTQCAAGTIFPAEYISSGALHRRVVDIDRVVFDIRESPTTSFATTTLTAMSLANSFKTSRSKMRG